MPDSVGWTALRPTVDAASVPDDLVADRLDSAGYSLALQVDSDGSAELTTTGTAFGTTTALTDPDQLVNMGKLLDALDDDDDVQNAWTTLENEEDLDR